MKSVLSDMTWYYAIDGAQYGPISQEQLLDFVEAGIIKDKTLVWKEGWPQWQSYENARAGMVPEPRNEEQLPAGQHRCVECRKGFPSDQVVQVGKSWICASCKPVFLQKLSMGLPTGGAVWRRRKEFVIARDSSLPDRCVKCNAPVNGERLKRKLYWHHPAVYIALLANVLLYALIALCIRKRVTIDVGFCSEHRSKRRWAILTVWLLILLGVAGISLAVKMENGLYALAGVVLILAALIWALVKVRVVYPTKIDNDYAYVRGACPAYLAELPEWNGM